MTEAEHQHLTLIADDELTYRESLTRLAVSHHARAIAVCSQLEAEEVLRTEQPCTLFVDLGLLLRPGDKPLPPGEPVPGGLARLGLRVVEYARRRAWARGTEFPFIVVMTGQSELDAYAYSNDAYRHGANYFIPKPIWNPKRQQEDPDVLMKEGFALCAKAHPDGCPAVSTPTDPRPRKLKFVGKKKGQGHLVLVDGAEYYPGPGRFRFLFRLHLGRACGGEGWVHGRDAFREGANHSQPYTRLLADLGPAACIVEKQPRENGKDTGRYRLRYVEVEVDEAALGNEKDLRELLSETLLPAE